MTELASIVEAARAAFSAAPTPADLENAKAQFLGKSGRITELMKGMAALSVDEKKTLGASINLAKQDIETALTERRQALADAQLQAQLQAQALDVTLPGRARGQGSLHPVSLAQERIERIFASMGFDVADGPEIESDWFSFTSLNNPPNHPARSMQDTFYVDTKGADGVYYNLRPHTSPMQIRYAQAHVRKHGGDFDVAAGRFYSGDMPEIRVIAPGRTFRVDSDATHSPMFHQVEGLWVGEDISFKDLKSVYLSFITQFLKPMRCNCAFGRATFRLPSPAPRSTSCSSPAPCRANGWRSPARARCIRR